MSSWPIGWNVHHSMVFGSGNPFRQSAEVTHALPHRMCVPLFQWLASDYLQPGALLVFTGNLGLLFPHGISHLSRGRYRLEGLGSLYVINVDCQR